MKDELELCRFCEGEAMIISLFPTPPHGRTFVQCKSCQATGPVGTREQAIAAWNARPIPQAGDTGELADRCDARADTLEALGRENRPLTSEHDVAAVVLTREILREAATTIRTLQARLDAVREEEREACAKVAMTVAERHRANSQEYDTEEDGGDGSYEQCLVSAIACMDVANALRARGEG